MCQCPKRGDLHFYTHWEPIQKMVFAECQCPKRGDLHFYKKSFIRILDDVLCQCPKRGDLHFYKTNIDITKFIKKDVSMP